MYDCIKIVVIASGSLKRFVIMIIKWKQTNYDIFKPVDSITYPFDVLPFTSNRILCR